MRGNNHFFLFWQSRRVTRKQKQKIQTLSQLHQVASWFAVIGFLSKRTILLFSQIWFLFSTFTSNYGWLFWLFWFVLAQINVHSRFKNAMQCILSKHHSIYPFQSQTMATIKQILAVTKNKQKSQKNEPQSQQNKLTSLAMKFDHYYGWNC